MKNEPVKLIDKVMLLKRALIESSHDQLQNIANRTQVRIPPTAIIFA